MHSEKYNFQASLQSRQIVFPILKAIMNKLIYPTICTWKLFQKNELKKHKYQEIILQSEGIEDWPVCTLL